MLANLTMLAVLVAQNRVKPHEPVESLPNAIVQFTLEKVGGEGKESTIRLTVVNNSKKPFLFDTKGGTGLHFELKDPKGAFRRVNTKTGAAKWADQEEDLARAIRIVMPGESARCEIQPFNGYVVHSAVIGSGRGADGRRTGVEVRNRDKESIFEEDLQGQEIEIRCTLVASRSFALIKRKFEQPEKEAITVEFPNRAAVSNTLRLRVPAP